MMGLDRHHGHVTGAMVEELRRGTDRRGPAQRLRHTLDHLAAACPECRAVLQVYGHTDREPSASWETVLGAELRAAGGLVAELVHLSPYRAQGLILGSPRFQRWGLAMRMVEMADREAPSSPREAEVVAALAVAIADQLDEARYTPEIVLDARARAEALHGDLLRRLGNLPAAERALDRAGSLIARGSGGEPFRAEVELARCRWLVAVGRAGEAVKRCRWVARWAREPDHEHLAWGVESIVARAELLDGKPDRAVARLERLVRRMRGRDARPALEWKARLDLAEARCAAGRPRGALDDLARLRVLAADGLPEHQKGRLLSLEGRALAALAPDGRPGEAGEALAAAGSALQAAGRGLEAALALVELVGLEVEQGRPEQARARVEGLTELLASPDLPPPALAAVVDLQAAIRRGEAPAEPLRRCHRLLSGLLLRRF